MRLSRFSPTPLLVFGVALLVLLRQSAPGLTFEDSGELAAAASCFGVPHPPGYPLLMIVGGALAKLLAPFGIEAARALVLVSVVSAALCMALLARFVEGRSGKRSIAGFLVAGMLLASPTFVAQAVVAETYALAAALTAAMLLAAERARPAMLGLLFGLALTAHPASVFLFPLLAFGVLRASKQAGATFPRSAVRALAGLALGLSLYLYVPLAAATQPAVNWGGIDSVRSLVDHLLRRQFAGGPARDLLAQASFLAEFLIGQWPLLIAVALIFGLKTDNTVPGTKLPVSGQTGPTGESSATAAAKNEQQCAWHGIVRFRLVAVTLLVTSLGLFWAQHWPVDEALARVRLAGSFTPVVVLSAALVGLLLARIEERLDDRLPPPLLFLAGALLALVHVAPSYGEDSPAAGQPTLAAFVDMSDVTEAEAYARAVLGAMPKDGIVVISRLGYSDVLFFPLLYAQVALGLRPDVLVIDRELLGSEWYRAQLATARPELAADLATLASAYAALPAVADARRRRLTSAPFLRQLAQRGRGIALVGRPSPRFAKGLTLAARAEFWWLSRTAESAPRAPSAVADTWLDLEPGAYSDPWRKELVRMARAREAAE